MTTKRMWICGLAMMCAGLAAPLALAQDAETKAAEKAIDAADPDAVDPVAIQGEKWTLEFKFDKPEPIVVASAETGEKEVYWYVVYTVTNKTGADRQFVPVFSMYSSTGAIRRAGLFPAVFDTVKKTRKIQFLENAVQMIGKMLQGDDNARTGVAIFPPLDRATTRFTIFVEGLSGEYIEKPSAGAPPEKPVPPTAQSLKAEAKMVRLRKTLAISYDLPGDRWWRNLDQPIFQGKKWTWR